MKLPGPSRPTHQPPIARIEADTPIVPRAVMEAVCEEAAIWMGQALPRRWIRELTAHANTVYACNPSFRRNVRAKGNKGRDYLWAFTRHWLTALMCERRPRLHARLPDSYSIGHPLPPKRSAPRRRLETDRRIPPRPRPAPNDAFAAAAHFSFP